MIGLFQQVYSGTPLSSYISVWGAPVFVEGRGKWVNMTRDSTTGNWVAGSVTDARTPHFSQSDLSAYQDFHVSKTNERLVARVGADCFNCFNQHHVTIINSNLIRTGSINPATCGTAGTNCTATGAAQAGFDYGVLMTQGLRLHRAGEFAGQHLEQSLRPTAGVAESAHHALPGPIHLLNEVWMYLLGAGKPAPFFLGYPTELSVTCRPWWNARFARCGAETALAPTSTGAFGSLRDRTQSRKF